MRAVLPRGAGVRYPEPNGANVERFPSCRSRRSLYMTRPCFLPIALLCVCQIGSAQIDVPPTAEGQPPGVGRAAEPYKVHADVRPKIVVGPYIVAPTDTSAMVAWVTDIPAHSKAILEGNGPPREIVNSRHGLIPFGTVHSVILNDLKPGTAYGVRVVSTAVVKMQGYWPEKGMSVQSAPLAFTTWDPGRPSVTFVSVSDTHEDSERIADLMKLVDWPTTDFLLQTGDAFNDGPRESIVAKWLQPLIGGMTTPRPLLYGRGNHDTRGTIARELFDYVPTPEGRFYYTRDIGPMHLLVVDNGEDKPDRTNVYARLNDMAAYRNEELAWFQAHMKTSTRAAQAPFRVAVMHQPNWAPMLESDQRDAWNDWANAAKIDLVVAGHTHRFAHRKPGQSGNNRYHVIIVGQNQLGRFTVSQNEITASVRNRDGSLVYQTTIPRAAEATGK
jgi:acid phosphatase type 7